MPHTRYLVASLIVLACSAVPVRAKEIDREKLNPVLGSIVKVEAITSSGGYSLGTAVSIAPGRFVTNCHVTAQATRVDLLYTGLRWTAANESSDTEHDICLLDVPALREVEPVRRRSANEMKVGQDVVAIGFTFGTGLRAQIGKISALHPLDGSVVIKTSTPFSSGASGGGLFDDEGRLIGVLTFRLPGAEGFYFSIPADWINPKVEAAEAYTKIAPLQGPRPFWARPEEAQPYFMRATRLEAASDWQSLIRLTDAWAESDERDPEPWFIRGQAYAHIDRTEAAIKSYKAAIARDPNASLAWFNLGELYSRGGLRDAVIDVLSHLRPLDPELADDLAVRGGIGTAP